MKNILFVSYYFNDKTASSSVRVKAMANNLPKYDWYPIVICPNFEDNNPKEVQYKDLYEVHETEYEYMLDKWKRGFGLNKSPKVAENKKIAKEENPSKLIHYMGEIFAYPDGMKYWYKPAMETIDKIISEKEIDAIFTASWPVTAHKIGYETKKKYNIPWVASLHDLWSQNPYIKHNSIRQYFEKRLELKTLSIADAIITSSPNSTKKLRELHKGKTIETVLTGFENKYIANRNIAANNDKLKIIYTGSLYDGKRNPRPLFKATEELIDEGKIDSNKIEFEFYGDYKTLEPIIKELKYKETVKNHDKIPRTEIIKKQKNADILLILSWNHPNESLVIPGKIYEYLASKKPILSIGYKECGVKDIIEYTNTGKHLSDYEDIKNYIEKLYLEFNENKKIAYKGDYNKLNEFAQKNTIKKLVDLLDKVK